MGRKEALALLGLEEGYSVEELKSAYRKCAIKCHPDKGGSKVAFVRLHEAYELLQRYLVPRIVQRPFAPTVWRTVSVSFTYGTTSTSATSF